MNRAMIPSVPRLSVTAEDSRWTFVVHRDASANGSFVYAVRTTGVYCRPSCPSRRAKPDNVTFYATCKEAEAARYRACRRCRPNADPAAGRNAAVIETCRLIEAAEELPKLDKLAASVGMNPFHFHRQFKAVTGLTPRAYAAAHRARKVREGLARPDRSVTETIYAAGFNPSSRFYETTDEVPGMTPTTYRRGGKDADIRFAVGACSLCSILLALSDKGVCAILIGDDPDQLVRDLQDRFRHANLIGGDAGFEQLIAKVVGFVEAPKLGLDLPLDIRGTAFQQRVWEALREIPAGRTVSYRDVARRIGKPNSARAVAQACAANPIAVAIPCHCVMGNDGGLAGYRWGVERKRALLEKETRP